jgi:hypothetical protein
VVSLFSFACVIKAWGWGWGLSWPGVVHTSACTPRSATMHLRRGTFFASTKHTNGIEDFTKFKELSKRIIFETLKKIILISHQFLIVINFFWNKKTSFFKKINPA